MKKGYLVHLSNYSHLSRKNEIKTHVKSFFKESSHDTIRINLASQSALPNRLQKLLRYRQMHANRNTDFPKDFPHVPVYTDINSNVQNRSQWFISSKLK